MTHNYLIKFRLANNLSQPEAADYLGVGKAFISDFIINPTVSHDRVGTIRKITTEIMVQY